MTSLNARAVVVHNYILERAPDPGKAASRDYKHCSGRDKGEREQERILGEILACALREKRMEPFPAMAVQKIIHEIGSR